MPPDGYPALQYLQSVRVRKYEATPNADDEFGWLVLGVVVW